MFIRNSRLDATVSPIKSDDEEKEMITMVDKLTNIQLCVPKSLCRSKFVGRFFILEQNVFVCALFVSLACRSNIIIIMKH